MISVVLTDVSQFTILTLSCLVITFIAMTRISPATLMSMVPAGWGDLFFGWHLNLDWSEHGVLEAFYRQVRPWGFWGPVVESIRKTDPAFQPNKEFGHDMMNVAIGVVCQFTLVTAPIYFVLKNWTGLLASLALFVVTAAVLKRTWFDRVEA